MTIGLLKPHNLIEEAVNGLHWRSSLDIHKMLKDNGDFCICYSVCEGDRLSKKINVEKMVRILPMHLMTVLMSPDRDEKFEYLLSGIRLLQTFCDLSSRHTKLEQVLFDDVKLSAHMLDLLIYTIVVLGGNRQVDRRSHGELLVYATLVSSCFYLMHGFISPNYQDLVQVLLAHPKVDLFIEGAFGAVHNVVSYLEDNLVTRQCYLPNELDVGPLTVVNIHCQQAEAALQFLHTLCQHKLFRDRVAKNKELCGNCGVLRLAHTILSLIVTPQFIGSTFTIASISRMKAKVLSILQHLFEAESVSFLDEVANAGNLDLAKDVVFEVRRLLGLGLSKASKCIAAPEYPMGFVLLNAMRLADVLTDDSNFRSIFIELLSMDLGAVLCLSHEDFLSMLCSSDIFSKEDEATVDFDLFTSVGWALSDFSSVEQSTAPQLKLNLQNNLTMASYAHQRSSLIIKMIANLHCFVPNLCKEEDRNRFIQNIMSGLRKDYSTVWRYVLPCTSYTPIAERGTGVCKNICSLLRHAESLIPHSVNEEDFMIFRVFCDQLQQLIYSESTESQVQVKDIQGTGENLIGKEPIKEPLNLNNEEASENFDVQVEGAIKSQGVNEEMEIVERSKESDVEASNLETSGSDTSSTRGKSLVNQVENGELVQTMSTQIKESESGEVKEDEKAETLIVFEKQRKKRKRSIMSEDQIAMIEKALGNEPDMQRNSASIQLWANKLSQNGSEVITSSQLKNWLNNRKAKLARVSKQTGPIRENSIRSSSSSEEGLKRGGQQVILIDERGEEIGKGVVVRRDGEWYGLSLETRQVCVVDVMELRSGSYDWSKMVIPYGSDEVGRTFGEANLKFGVMRVAWDVNLLQFQTLLH